MFAIDVGNYSILSNHQHLIARTRPDIAATWSDEQVAWRWKLAWPACQDGQWVVTGEVTTEHYDRLELSPGAAPIRPPLPGIDLPGIFSLRTVPDARRIREWLERGSSQPSGPDTGSRVVTKLERAVVVGGGLVGLEMTENLVRLGCQVTLIEKLDQVMPGLDAEMARLVESYPVKHGVHLVLNDGVVAFNQSHNGSLEVRTASGKIHPADIAILAMGLCPETALASMAGLDLGPRWRNSRR